MQKSNDIIVASERGNPLPVVVGKCSHCGCGDRSLVLTQYLPNSYSPELGVMRFQCVKCFKSVHRRVCDVTEG